MAIYEPLLDPTQGSGINSDEYAPAFDKELTDGGYPGDTDGEPLLGDEPVKARMRFTVFNLGNTIMGGGILSLPYAFKVPGLPPSRILFFCVQRLTKRRDCSARGFVPS